MHLFDCLAKILEEENEQNKLDTSNKGIGSSDYNDDNEAVDDEIRSEMMIVDYDSVSFISVNEFFFCFNN